MPNPGKDTPMQPELTSTFLDLIQATHTFHRHIESCQCLHNCDDCRDLIEAKNRVQKKYDEMVYGSLPLEITGANLPHDKLVFARQQTD